MIKEELKEKMIKDISIIQKCLDERSNNSEEIYDNLKAEYSMVDKNFCIGIPQLARALDSDRFRELGAIKHKLEMYIMLDCIPVTYNENVAKEAQTSVAVNANKVKNCNIGQGNRIEKNVEITNNLKTEGKNSFVDKLKKIFRSGK